MAGPAYISFIISVVLSNQLQIFNFLQYLWHMASTSHLSILKMIRTLEWLSCYFAHKIMHFKLDLHVFPYHFHSEEAFNEKRKFCSIGPNGAKHSEKIMV